MNIYDIVAETGTSIFTVSRVLDNKGDVNPRIRDRVEAIPKKYDYKPSAIARGMVLKTMKNIAILTVDVRMTHYVRMIYVIEQESSNLGYNVPMCNTGGSIQGCSRYFEILLEKQTDRAIPIGPIFNGPIKCPETTAEIKDMLVVIANGQVKLPDFYSVLVDDTKTIHMASDYMSDRGRTDLFYAFDIVTDSGRTERQGFLEATKLGDVPDGNDRVPEGIVITGCNSSPGSRICESEPATLNSKPELLGRMYASLLRNRMERKESATSVAIQPGLVIRGSTSF